MGRLARLSRHCHITVCTCMYSLHMALRLLHVTNRLSASGVQGFCSALCQSVTDDILCEHKLPFRLKRLRKVDASKMPATDIGYCQYCQTARDQEMSANPALSAWERTCRETIFVIPLQGINLHYPQQHGAPVYRTTVFSFSFFLFYSPRAQMQL